jgi:hypothetical protein
MSKLPPWLSVGQTIAWIAFRRATPTADWEDPSKPPAVVWEDLLPETHNWRAPRDLLLAALEARTAREEWEAPPDEWWTTEEVLDEIDRLERETGMPPAALAAELSADIERTAAAEAQITQAEADLRDAVSKGRITAYARRVGEEENAAIPALALSRRDRKITEAGNIIAGAGVPEWTDVQFRAEDVLAIWPAERRQEAAQTAAAETRMKGWLVEQMKAAPNAPTSKPEMRKRAEAAGHVVSDRAFIRAWPIAVKEANAPAWSRPGRKSRRRIETPV